MKFIEGIIEMWSEGSKISSKRVIATLMTLVLCVVIFIYPENHKLIDSLMFFIGGLIGFTVANKHRSFNKPEGNEELQRRSAGI